jgi:hypothetical protein
MKHETFFNNYKNPILATFKVKILNPKIVVIFGSTLRGRIYVHVALFLEIKEFWWFFFTFK